MNRPTITRSVIATSSGLQMPGLMVPALRVPVLRVPALLVLALLVLALPSCSAVKRALFSADPEPVVKAHEGYHQTSTESNQLDLGPDQKSLLEAFTGLKQDNIELRSRIEHLDAENGQLRARLDSTDKNLKAEQRRRAVALADMDRLKKDLQRRDAEFLSLSIEKARRDKEYYSLRVAMLKDQLDAFAQTNAAPAAGKRQ